MYLFFIALKKYLTGLSWELCRSFFYVWSNFLLKTPIFDFFIIPSHLRIKYAFAVLVQQSLLKMGNIRSLDDYYKLHSLLLSCWISWSSCLLIKPTFHGYDLAFFLVWVVSVSFFHCFKEILVWAILRALQIIFNVWSNFLLKTPIFDFFI